MTLAPHWHALAGTHLTPFPTPEPHPPAVDHAWGKMELATTSGVMVEGANSLETSVSCSLGVYATCDACWMLHYRSCVNSPVSVASYLASLFYHPFPIPSPLMFQYLGFSWQEEILAISQCIFTKSSLWQKKKKGKTFSFLYLEVPSAHNNKKN